MGKLAMSLTITGRVGRSQLEQAVNALMLEVFKNDLPGVMAEKECSDFIETNIRSAITKMFSQLQTHVDRRVDELRAQESGDVQ